MLTKKYQFTCRSAANHKNTANLALQTYEKNQWNFYGTAKVSTLAPEIMFLTEVPLQKFLFLQKQ